MVISIGVTDNFVEKRLEGHKPSDPLVVSHFDRDTQVKIFETLKGENKSKVHALLKSCIGGSPDLFDEVVLFYIEGTWHAKHLPSDDIANFVYRTLSSSKINR